jgi:phage host-nuclease inhibitor protein Gam
VNATPEAPIEREDVTAIMRALFDIRWELVRIRRALEDEDGEEEAEDHS